jgi:hypothetical protein
MAQVHCKPYHHPLTSADSGTLRTNADRKSKCPGWLTDERLRKKLLDKALPDPKGDLDCFGRVKKFWNAVNGVYLIGVSTNEQEPRYNCYPEQPVCLFQELSSRANRTIEELMHESE